MAFYCQFCDTRNPEGDTKILFVNGGDMLEFCPRCGKREDIVKVPGRPEIKTLDDMFKAGDKED